MLLSKSSNFGGVKVSNAEIRAEMKLLGLAIWQVADKVGVCEMTLIRWLRKELSEEKRNRVCLAIEDLRSKKAVV